VAGAERPRAFLWSKAHAKQEFALVLGSGAETVAVDSLVYYKIREDSRGFLDYVYHLQNPEEALEGYAYRALMEQTRNATLEEVLSINRAQFANQFEASLRQYVEENRLGIEIVDVALINLHPPIAVAAAYLDVISAEIDAVRYEAEASGEKNERIKHAERDSNQAIADAEVRRARRVGLAQEESAEFVAVGKGFSVAPEAFRLRMRGDTIAEILSDKPLIVMDRAFLGGEGEMLFDMRPESRRGDPATERHR
jgi:membrane protease subunit HflK